MDLLTFTYSLKDIPLAIAIVDLDLYVKDYSISWYKKFGITRKERQENTNIKSIASIPEDVYHLILSIINGENSLIENFECKNDQRAWFNWKISATKDEDNRITGAVVIADDITEKKKKEELLIQAQSVAKIGSWELNLTTNQIYWSDETKVIHEVGLDYIPNLDEGINFYKKGIHRETITNAINNAINEGISWEKELQITTAKGNDIWIRAKGKPEIINNKCVRVFGTFQNIDKYKKQQIAFEKTSDRLKVATETAKIGIWEYDVKNDNLIWDDNMYEMYNINLKEKNTKGILTAWKERLCNNGIQNDIKDLSTTLDVLNMFNTVFKISPTGDEIRYIKSKFTTIEDGFGNITRLVGTNWDITQLKVSQLKLSKNEKSFKGVFQNSSIGMALVSLENTWIDVNDSICESFGYSKDDLLNKNFQDITHPKDLTKGFDRLELLKKGEIDNYQIDKRYIDKDGAIVYAILTVTAIRNFKGEVSHLLTQISDITSRINAENKTKKLNTVTKNQNKSLLNFAHIVSHNLRSHSSNLSMLTKFLLDENNEDEIQDLKRMLKDATESLNDTVYHLNDVVQISTNTEDKLKSVNFNNAIKAVQHNISALIREKNANCIIEVPTDKKVQVVPAYLDSILLNLFTNSIKYSSPNRKLEISIKVKDINKTSIQLEFKDNGQGIDLVRHGKKLFGMYKTFHTHKDARGIGLFITKNQIEAMGGSISLTSEVNKGTTFNLIFKKGL
ncbi:PAS domain S-box protein [Cellulophaga baltica]|uniref:PAS domain-containing sensor histidine kinase n=1 Tax=Cellulophaga TaxID=104264 RepID=UPI001C07AFAF|nr:MULTISPECIES: PAS domain-containing sensor histidine kinase [Cellulophaga]MBU2995679.1 PAS domain S-box protein [Cellulophaga baltica]MDO6767073.1 PAS domain S-box protein [Cellulophaga sp. 1_MG-2023]